MWKPGYDALGGAGGGQMRQPCSGIMRLTSFGQFKVQRALCCSQLSERMPDYASETE
ncbi:hypothetical protein ATR01nite_14690 [Acetobacter tropicalis]|uniref:Uncharacterized protein n=2 Tax=Acetobacter tropicalis TaxID=104102 RepID=A0A511FN75_9PROT|nr:hypothetical protein ATR01nite_14690 [Acetobacter tropicalis]